MTKPYYKDSFVTLYHGDCLEIDEWQTADVLVTDPPYGMSYSSNARKKKHDKIANDDSTFARDKVIEIWGDKPALVFGTWRVQRPPKTRNVIVWDKGAEPGQGDLSLPWGNSHEEVYVLGRGFLGKRRSNVYRVKKIGTQSDSRPNHPTPKPVGLMEQLIEHCPNGIIADPFAGSGATLIAARNMARFAVGVELDEQYCELISNRLSQAVFHFDV
jgi:site-specific DNA-methyltransferase (adenine-specific)